MPTNKHKTLLDESEVRDLMAQSLCFIWRMSWAWTSGDMTRSIG